MGTDDKKSIVKAFLAADFYKQKKLMEKCEEHIETWSISVDEVCELLNVSIGILKLKEKCLDFIKNNAADVISSPTFFSLNYKALVSILESDAFKDVSILLFKVINVTKTFLLMMSMILFVNFFNLEKKLTMQ